MSGSKQRLERRSKDGNKSVCSGFFTKVSGLISFMKWSLEFTLNWLFSPLRLALELLPHIDQ